MRNGANIQEKMPLLLRLSDNDNEYGGDDDAEVKAPQWFCATS